VMDLEVFDRWGRLVARDSGTTVMWNGGDYAPGAYPYIIRFAACAGGMKSRNGIIHLIK